MFSGNKCYNGIKSKCSRDAETSGSVTKVHGGTSMTKIIALTQGKVAQVSDHRFDYLNQWKWYANKDGNKWYARRNEGNKSVKMHRQITGVTDPEIDVDHRDGDGLNNTDENLRVCTATQNLANRGKTKRNTSGYKGVSKIRGRWYADLMKGGKHVFRGYFSTAEEAARAYDKAAREHYGEFAYTNFEV